MTDQIFPEENKLEPLEEKAKISVEDNKRDVTGNAKNVVQDKAVYHPYRPQNFTRRSTHWKYH